MCHLDLVSCSSTLSLFLTGLRESANSGDPHEAAYSIIHHSCLILACDRASIFYVDEASNELVLMISKGRLPSVLIMRSRL